MTDYRIDFRILQQFGLSLNTKKIYKMVYEPCTWTLLGVYEQEAYTTLLRSEASSTKSTVLRPFVPNDLESNQGESSSSLLVPQKGIFNHLSVWDVLDCLRKVIVEEAYMSLDDEIDEKRRKLPEVYQTQRDRTKVLYQNDFILSRIHPKLHAYPEYMESICDFVKI